MCHESCFGYTICAVQTVTDPQLQRVQDAAAEVEAYLEHYLQGVSLPENLLEAIRYSVLGGGKRLRPVLTLLSCDAVGGQRQAALAPASALELIHAFSLVHDDLPAMDDDDMRRGRPTLHIHAGEAMAILAGDAMMSLAFELVSSPGELANNRHAARITAELARGTTSMIAGQVYDTLAGFPDQQDARKSLELIHRNKTGALLTAACRIGGLCGDADEQQLVALTSYGEAVGLMFQIVDDLLDVTQSSEHLGKAAGKDASAGKLTFPGLLGIESSQVEVERLRVAALAALEPLGESAAGLHELCNYLAVRTK